VQAELTLGTGTHFRHLASLPAFSTSVGLGLTCLCLLGPFPSPSVTGRQNLAVMLGFSKLLYLPSCYVMFFPAGPPARLSPIDCTDKCLRQQLILLLLFFLLN
jgi:hypothetical protein